MTTNSSSYDFSKLIEDSLSQITVDSGNVVKGVILHISNNYVVINVGLKSEAIVDASQFADDEGNIKIKVGDWVDVMLKSVEDGLGRTIISHEEAKQAASWARLEKAFHDGEIIVGHIAERVRGGFTVDLDGVRGFLPGSLVDVKPTKDAGLAIEGKDVDLKVVKIDRKRNNIVVSRRAVVEADSSEERQALFDSLKEGSTVKGVVKNLTDYGAFVDLGGIDGLLHITDIAWKRVRHPGDVVKEGEEIEVKVLSFDREKCRISLGLKQLQGDPWNDLPDKFPINSRTFGTVTNITDYGCFVEFSEGIEGLVHMSEMDWTNKNIHPYKVVKVGQEVEVMVLDLNPEKRRISLGIKQCIDNPWDVFKRTFKEGDVVSGPVKSITDFGLFVGLDGGIDGLVHYSDLSWSGNAEEELRKYKKGDQIEAKILLIDSERERISIGIKQMESDPIQDFISEHGKDNPVNIKVTACEGKKVMVVVSDKPGVIGYMRSSEFSVDPEVGEEIQVYIVGLDSKTRSIYFSLRNNAASGKGASSSSSSSQDSGHKAQTLGDFMQDKLMGDSED